MIEELVKQKVIEMEGLSDEALKNADFFSLALYLQELNKIKELCEYELEGELNE